MTYENEKQFIDSLIENGQITAITPEQVREKEERFKKKLMETAIIPEGDAYISTTNALSGRNVLGEAPPMDIPNGKADLGEPDPDPDVLKKPDAQVDEPDPNVNQTPKSDVTQAIEALFMSNIVKPGEHFQEFKNERMREALRDQGVDDIMYNQIGRAFYTLDTQTDLIPNRRRG